MRRAVFALTVACVIIILMLTLAQVAMVKANPILSQHGVYVDSPKPTIYANPNVKISFYYNVWPNLSPEIVSFSFILDNKAKTTLNFKISNETIWSLNEPNPPSIYIEYKRYSVFKTLENLTNGDHKLKVYAYFSDGNAKTILDTTFTVDTNYVDPLLPLIVSPLNQTTYNITQVPLIYTTNNKVLWSYYRLDDSDLSYFEGNITLPSLSEGQHELKLSVVYNLSRTDSVNEWYTTQKMNSVTFYVDDVAPKITNVSVDSTDTSNLLLNFTVDENTSWVGYSLDNQANVTINGNAVLRDLPNGIHNVTVYAKDSAGNIGISETISFTVGLSPQLVIVAVIATVTIISGGLLVHSKRTRKG